MLLTFTLTLLLLTLLPWESCSQDSKPPPTRRMTRTPRASAAASFSSQGLHAGTTNAKFVTSFNHFSFGADMGHPTDANASVETVTFSSHSDGTDGPEGYGNRVTQQNVTQLIDRLLDGYDIKVRPPGPTTEEYSMDCYFRQSWQDSRLSYGEFSNISTALLPLGVAVLAKIWKPDTTVYNGKNSYFHDITSPNKFVRIYRDGRLVYSQRLTLRARCPMQLQKYPMDTQRCPLNLGSFAYTQKDVLYRWKNGNDKAVVLAEDLKLSQFYLLAAVGSNSTLRSSVGDYSMLSVEFTLQRHSGYFFIQIYAPCCLTVVLSWVGFWLNREASGDRITLGVTCVLTMTFLGIDTRSSGDYPRVSYMTALDLFVSMSFVYIFFSIVLYAFVHINTKYGTGDNYYRMPASALSYDTPERRNKLQRRRISRAASITFGSKRRYSLANCSVVDELHLREADFGGHDWNGDTSWHRRPWDRSARIPFSRLSGMGTPPAFLKLCFGVHPYRPYSIDTARNSWRI
ncbi:Gamma-aminobutyric acid receptor subunit alpha-6 [Hypsibius exemplaris]|uniref:Gamma-aminobutyric acid receptor subunit alpha-6 n=1 Tax=Hypsibius exemplaris TaxID=2072580 RepID=A0A1W0WSR4_HYPEX|nr:Gamma-aminobutyric acid receptor subunit alpha-6 [Hypsibius exemplaris]